MPAVSRYSGVFSVGNDFALPGAIICDSIKHDFMLDVEPSQVISGSAQMLVHKIGNLTPTYAINGPMLIGDKTGILDTYDYVNNIYIPTGSILPAVSWGPSISSKTLKVDENGSAVSASWLMDPDCKTQIGNIWVAREALVSPLRVAHYYDFFVKHGADKFGLVQSLDANFTYTWESFNPIGGASDLIEPSENWYEHPWHIPVRIFKGLKLSVDFNILFDMAHSSLTNPIYATSNTNTSVDFATTTQPRGDFVYQSDPLMALHTYGPTDNNLLSNMLGDNFEIKGWYVNGISNNFSSGVCTSSIKAEAIASLLVAPSEA